MNRLFVSVLCLTIASACSSDGDSNSKTRADDAGATDDDAKADDDTQADDDDATGDDAGDDDTSSDDDVTVDDDAGTGDDTASDDDVTVDPSDATDSAIFGHVEDSAGDPIAGVFVHVGGSTATTDQDGDYALASDTGDGIQVLFEKSGFITTMRQVDVLDGRDSAAHATLVAEAAAVQVDAEMGGMVSGKRGALVTIPPNALVDEDGQPVTGMVDVHLTPLDPSRENEVGAVAGAFLADSASGDELLESLGMVDITIQKGGQKLQLDQGETLELVIPAPDGVDPPATIPLWSFDTAIGRWVEEGEATYDEGAGAYFAEASHMSAWNCDRVAEATCINGHVRDQDGNPVAGTRVSARGLDYFGSSETTTGEDGRFYLAVRKNSDVSVLAEHLAGGGQVREVKSGDADTDVPPRPDEPDCLDIGDFEVERGVVVLEDGTEVSCDEASVQNSGFADTCATGMTDVFLCFDPSGDCSYNVTESPLRFEYGNGAAMEFEADDGGANATVRYLNSQGALCGTVSSNADGASTISDADGQSYQYVANDNGDLTITCPDGEVVTLTASEQQILDACNAPAEEMQSSQGSSSQCQPTGIDGQCLVDADCAPGEVCCEISPDLGLSECLDTMTCDLFMMSAQ